MVASPVQLQKILTVKAPPAKVFSYWSDFANFKDFISIIEDIEVIDDKISRWVIAAPMGHKVVFESRITIFEPGKELVWESRHADGFARGVLRLSETAQHTRLQLDFEYILYRSWMRHLARLVRPFGFPSLAFDHGLLDIKEKIEKDQRSELQRPD